MERDFMGLNSKDEAVFSKSSAVQWTLSSFEEFNNRISRQQQKNTTGHVPMDACHVSRAPVQLTIFYGGMVNVYDDMSPEKAQAIMLLAGNGAKETTPTTPAGGRVHVSQPVNNAFSSPLSVGPSASPGSTAAMDAPNSLRRMMQSAVPQMRGASLARFLQKRKERVMASTPYNLDKSSLESSDKPGSSKDEKK